MAFRTGLTPSVPKTDRRPEYIPVTSNIEGIDIPVCWNCAYGECEHCDDHNRCQHTHWWENARVSQAEAFGARYASTRVRSTSEQGEQLDLFASSGSDSPDPYRISA